MNEEWCDMNLSAPKFGAVHQFNLQGTYDLRHAFTFTESQRRKGFVADMVTDVDIEAPINTKPPQKAYVFTKADAVAVEPLLVKRNQLEKLIAQTVDGPNAKLKAVFDYIDKQGEQQTALSREDVKAVIDTIATRSREEFAKVTDKIKSYIASADVEIGEHEA